MLDDTLSPVVPLGPVQIWSWATAPQPYRDLSPHGGGERLVVIVPASWQASLTLDQLPLPLWSLLTGSGTACDWGLCSRHALPEGALALLLAR